MEFKELNINERLKNFNKLWANDEDIIIIAKEYAKIANEDENECVKIALKHNTMHKNKMNMKKRLKGQKVVD